MLRKSVHTQYKPSHLHEFSCNWRASHITQVKSHYSVSLPHPSRALCAQLVLNNFIKEKRYYFFLLPLPSSSLVRKNVAVYFLTLFMRHFPISPSWGLCTISLVLWDIPPPSCLVPGPESSSLFSGPVPSTAHPQRPACCGLNVCVPPNSHDEILAPNVMALRGAALGCD